MPLLFTVCTEDSHQGWLWIYGGQPASLLQQVPGTLNYSHHALLTRAVNKLMNSAYFVQEATAPTTSTWNIPRIIKVYSQLEQDFKLIPSRFIHDKGGDVRLLSNV